MTPLLERLLLAGGAGTHPALIPGCFMCFDAWRPDMMTVVGGNQVSSWTDLISGTAFVQGTGASRPLFDSNFVTGDASDDSLAYTAGAIAGWPLSGSFEVVGLANVVSAGSVAGTQTFFAYPNSAANGMAVSRAPASSINRLSVVRGDGSSASSVTANTGDFSGKSIFRFAQPTGGPIMRFTVNDALNIQNTTTVPLFSGATRHRFFANAAASAGAFANVGIHLIAGFSRLLSETEWAGIRAYLKARRKAV